MVFSALGLPGPRTFRLAAEQRAGNCSAILGGLLLARFVAWAGARVTVRIDQSYQQADQLVRSEAAKHRHSVAQVITWVVITMIYVLVTIQVLQRLGFPDFVSLVAPATVLGAALGFGAQRWCRTFSPASSSSPNGSTDSVTSCRIAVVGRRPRQAALWRT